MKIKKFNWALVVLLLISFLVRIYKINSLSLFGDEVDVGYQAYSLLQTGRDYKGNFLPTYIQSLSESRAPLLIYLSIPGIKILGLTELGVRITPIIFGVLSIYLFYKLIFLLSKSNKLALFSAFALSFSPWHFHYSRTAFEVTLLLSLTLLGVYLFEKFILKNKAFLLFLSIISFGLTFYTYNTANIFTPLLVIFLLIINFKKLKENLTFNKAFISILLTITLLLPILIQIFSGNAANRFNLINIFHDQKTIDQIINKRTGFSAVSPKIETIFHNKPTAWLKNLTDNYSSAFSFSFLFLSGDQLNLRHNITGFGLVFIIFLPFLLIGIFNINLKEKINSLMIFWLICSPIASSFTINGGNHPTRLFLMTVPIAYFSTLGLLKLIKLKNIFSTILLVLVSLIFIWEVSAYSHEYFIHYPKESFKVWNYGYKQLFKELNYPNKETLVISNTNFNSLLSFLFYNKISPKQININDNESKNIIRDFNGFKISSDIFFVNNWNTTDLIQKLKDTAQPNETYLLFQLNDIPGDMDFSQKPLEGFRTIQTVYNPNHTILGQVIQKL